MHETYDHLKIKTLSELGQAKQLQMLWRPTRKANPEDSEIQKCTKPMNTYKQRHIRNQEQKHIDHGYGHRPTK
jgi:hypothetical protein